MKPAVWNFDKNEWLKKKRNITFELLIGSRFIGIEKHPSRFYQQLMLFEYQRYVWVVPYVDNGEAYFLKTAFPSRKYTKKYLKKGG